MLEKVWMGSVSGRHLHRAGSVAVHTSFCFMRLTE